MPRLHNKFDNAQGSDYARVGSMELNATEILEEHARGRDNVRAEAKKLLGIAVVELLSIAGGVRLGPGLLRSVMVLFATIVRPTM